MWGRRSRTAPAAEPPVRGGGGDIVRNPPLPWSPLTAPAPASALHTGDATRSEPAFPEESSVAGQEGGTERLDVDDAADAVSADTPGSRDADAEPDGADRAGTTESADGGDPDDVAQDDPLEDPEAGFARRIEKLLVDAGREASAMVAEARATVAQLHAEAAVRAQELVATARAQAAAIISEAHERADEASVAARGLRAAAEAELAEARQEAEAVRQRAWEDSSKLRREIDTHAQSLLARTHREVETSLREARLELSELAAQKADLEEATERLRVLVAAAVSAGLDDVER